MKRIPKIIPILAFAFAILLFPHSCANTTQAPTGGLKDTIPPVLIKVEPDPLKTEVPVIGQHFRFTFDEYVTVKNPQNIFLSPPSRKVAKTKMKGHTLEVWFEDTLRRDMTYTIDFTSAIADNNEGNMFPGYTYVFSTGKTVDSMMICGKIMDCSTLAPVPEATVLLYDDLSDSAVFLSPALYATKTDVWGFFSIRNIPPKQFRLYAIKDENNNKLYDPDNESIAFKDSIVVPYLVANDSLPELTHYDPLDTLNCLRRKPQYKMRLFRELNSKQYIKNKGRTSDRLSFISFNARKAHIDTMWISGIPSNRLITQFNPERDSLEIWVNDRRSMPDTFFLYVNYLKTDTLGKLSPVTENFKLVNPVPRKARRRIKKSELKKEDTTCVFTFNAKGETVESEGITMEFSLPIISYDLDSMKFISTNPRQQDTYLKARIEQDSINIKKYHILPDLKEYRTGYEYTVKLPHHAFIDINGNPSDSLVSKFSLPTDDKLSSLSLNIKGTDQKRFIIELLDEKKSKSQRRMVVEKDGIIEFKYLTAGKICIRITSDANKNDIVDTGDLLKGLQPEEVFFYELSDGNDVLDIPEKAIIEQTIDIKNLLLSNK